jgi:hypothetical protein
MYPALLTELSVMVRNPKRKDQETEADFYAKDLWEAWEWIKKNNSR